MGIMRKFLQFDWIIIIPSIILLTLSYVMISSTSPELVLNELSYIIIGFIFFLVMKEIDYKIYKPLGMVWYFSVIILLILTYVLGVSTRGAVRWVSLGGFVLQPSEICKPFIILFAAQFFTDGTFLSFKKIIKYLILMGIPLGLVFKQPDLGNTIVFFVITLALLLGGGIKKWIFLLSGLIVTVFSPIFWNFLKEYQRERIITFINPSHDPLGTGYNAIQSMIAVGSGELLGRGLGRGTQSHLKFLPEFHTDFVFATISEELGFIGGILILISFIVLLWRIIKIGQRSNDRFGFLISIGIFTQILIQVCINIGMNVGLLPITGITLPFLSYGGSSVVSTFIVLGIIANIHKQNNQNERFY